MGLDKCRVFKEMARLAGPQLVHGTLIASNMLKKVFKLESFFFDSECEVPYNRRHLAIASQTTSTT